MPYQWALGDGQIVEADYDRATDTLTPEQVQAELTSAFEQFGHTVTCTKATEDMVEVFCVTVDGANEEPIYISIKGTTPGGRANLNDEQRTQQKSKYINYAFHKHNDGHKAAQMGVYKRDGQVVFCAWKLKESTASQETSISKQIKIKTIADAMRLGFVQQDKGGGEYACAFRREFLYFYLANVDHFHTAPTATVAENGTFVTTQANDQATQIGCNILLYGVPGSGKSHKIKTEYCDNEDFMERVVFHPDYTYSDFVGQIMPTNVDGHIAYPFIPGPFTRILKKAIDNQAHNYYLVIEEINRGNAPAIFGEVFQLLDRVDGESEYGISNADIAQSVYGVPEQKVKIPANLFILATMNTADQNVFTLDTAFKRRWSMQSIENRISECTFADKHICGTQVTWRNFVERINELIIDLGDGNVGSEDTRLGAYFVRENELDTESQFAEKVLMYLWNDAFKFAHDQVFKPEYRTLDELINGFKTQRFGVFVDNIGFVPNIETVATNENETEE